MLFLSRREEFRERYLPKNESGMAGTEAITEEDGAQILPLTPGTSIALAPTDLNTAAFIYAYRRRN